MDKFSWQEIKSVYIDPVCKRHVRPPHDPETRACEILTTLYLRFNDLSPGGSEISALPTLEHERWLRSSIRGEVQKTFRMSKRPPVGLDVADVDQSNSGRASLLDDVCSTEAATVLLTLIPDLSEKQRLSLFTRYPIGGVIQPTEAEVAERFGITKTRVRQIRAEVILLFRRKFAARRLL